MTYVIDFQIPFSSVFLVYFTANELNAAAGIAPCHYTCHGKPSAAITATMIPDSGAVHAIPINYCGRVSLGPFPKKNLCHIRPPLANEKSRLSWWLAMPFILSSSHDGMLDRRWGKANKRPISCYGLWSHSAACKTFSVNLWFFYAYLTLPC